MSATAETRELGRTGLPVSRLGLGLAALGRPGYMNLGHAADLAGGYDVERMERHAHAVLDAAWDAGIRYFDVARSYGRGEEFVASWLAEREVHPEDCVVASKWGYTYTAGWSVTAPAHEVKDHSLAAFERQLRETQAILGPQLDLHQIHSATLETGVLEDRAVLSALAGLRGRGIAVGLSVSGPRQSDVIRRALDARLDGEPLFQCVQATWNLLEPSAAVALAEAREQGLGVVVKEGLANGRLTARNQTAEFFDAAVVLDRWCAALGCTRDALSLAAILAQPWCDVVLSGAATPEQLWSNVRALEVPWSDALAGELAWLAEPPDVYWATRSALAWN